MNRCNLKNKINTLKELGTFLTTVEIGAMNQKILVHILVLTGNILTKAQEDFKYLICQKDMYYLPYLTPQH